MSPAGSDCFAEGFLHVVDAFLVVGLRGVEVGEQLQEVGLENVPIFKPKLRQVQGFRHSFFELFAFFFFDGPLQIAFGDPQ